MSGHRKLLLAGKRVYLRQVEKKDCAEFIRLMQDHERWAILAEDWRRRQR